jgi:hypothetical protein
LEFALSFALPETDMPRAGIPETGYRFGDHGGSRRAGGTEGFLALDMRFFPVTARLPSEKNPQQARAVVTRTSSAVATGKQVSRL